MGTGIRPHNFTILRFRFCELVKSSSGSSVKNIINNIDRDSHKLGVVKLKKISCFVACAFGKDEVDENYQNAVLPVL